VILENNGFAVEMPMYIDSGADVSMIPFCFGRALGFKQEEGDTIQEIKGVSGAGLPYILKEVTVHNALACFSWSLCPPAFAVITDAI